jgi:NAD+--asparagine ADP-ribosyltransferase
MLDSAKDIHAGMKDLGVLPSNFETGSKLDLLPKNFSLEKSGLKEINYLSEYSERLRQTPKNSELGNWAGKRGESQFKVEDQTMKGKLKEYKQDGIGYKDAIPDFSPFSKSTVKIDHMTDQRPNNFEQADTKCAAQWNKSMEGGRSNWTPRDISNWRKDNKHTWHERNDMKTCDLLPAVINNTFGHLGGVSECKLFEKNKVS